MKTLNHTILAGNKIDDYFDEKIKPILSDKWYKKDRNYMKPYVNNTIFAYDSETSNYIDKNGNKKPFVFSLMLTIMNPDTKENVNILSRTIPEYFKVVRKIAKYLGCKVNHKIRTNKNCEPMYDTFGSPIYDLSNDKYIYIYVHNLPFDSAFILGQDSVFSVFANKMHHPYYYTTNYGVSYRDSVVMTQKSLAQLGQGLKEFTDKKQVGDFDYNKIRTNKTTFTKKEYGYVTNDTTVLAAFICEDIENYGGKVANLPMTMTGDVRHFVRSAINNEIGTLKELGDNGILPDKLNNPYTEVYNLDKNGAKDDKEFQRAEKKLSTYTGAKLSMTPDEYKLMQKCYAGGFTHSNPNHTGKIMKNVQSWDFTSSYPTRILAEKFACNNGGKVLIRNDEENKKILNKINNVDSTKFVYLFGVHFDYIKSKINYDYFLSSSKCKYDNNGFIESNGRVVQAQNVTTYMTSIDWDIFKRVYKFGKAKLFDCYVWRQDYLPYGMIASTLYFYNLKTKLKHVAGREKDYMRGKERLNSIYGMCVQSPIQDNVTYNPKSKLWNINHKKDYEDYILNKLIDLYNNSKSRFLYYLWGVEIAAYSRHDLWLGILECENDYLYSDTDSLKVINADKHKAFINKYNTEIVEKIKKTLKHFQLPESLMSPKDIKGEKHQLGVWDSKDGFYSYFKTLGAKRYIVIDRDSKKFEITIAGLSKAKGAKYLLDMTKTKHDKNNVLTKIDDKTIKKLFSAFNNQLYVPAKDTGKLAHYYVDNYKSFIVKDYQGHITKIPAGSGCLLKAIDFTLSLSKKFTEFLENFLNGYIKDSTITKNVL